jgi:hypothetical protein
MEILTEWNIPVTDTSLPVSRPERRQGTAQIIEK